VKAGAERHARYNHSAKGRARVARYEKTAKAMRRKIAYDLRRFDRPQPDGLFPLAIRKAALAEREEYEASGSSLSFLDWLNEVHPLPKLRALGGAS